jgi:hypothetical protein
MLAISINRDATPSAMAPMNFTLRAMGKEISRFDMTNAAVAIK